MSLARLFPELRAFRNDFFEPLDLRQDMYPTPRMDVIETKESFQVKADVPGFSKDQIDIDIQGNTLSIKGKYDKTKEQKDEHYHTQERVQSSFSRSLTLPFQVDPTKVKAELKDGVLQIMLPKNELKSSKVAIASL